MQPQLQLATHVARPVSVRATTILDVTDITNRAEGCGQSSPDLMLRLADGRNFKADSSMTSRYVPVVGDYLVTQADGYEYLNPKDVFERKYSAVTSGDTTIEQEIQAKGLTAPRVTPADIEANIAHECYFRPYDAGLDALRFQFLTDDHRDPEIRGRVRELIGHMSVMSTSAVRQDIDLMMAVPGVTHDALQTLTFCVLVLRNGFTVTGESACASPENFDAELGRKIARENAINKVWPLMGYAPKDRLADAA